MGVSGGGDLLYSLKNLHLAQIVSIATSRAAVNGRTVPRIDIDANWLIRKYSKDRSILIGSIIEVISAFVQAGFVVSIIHTKRRRLQYNIVLSAGSKTKMTH